MGTTFDPHAEATRLRNLANDLERMAAKYREAAEVLTFEPDGDVLAPRTEPPIERGEMPKAETSATSPDEEGAEEKSVWRNRIIAVLRSENRACTPGEIADKLATKGENRTIKGVLMKRDVFVNTIRNNLRRYDNKAFQKQQGGSWSLVEGIDDPTL